MNNYEKMAFLILAHNDPKHLKKLIYALDYPAFDIYVHVDAKVNIEQFEFDLYELKYSKLVVLDTRVKVYWADYSAVQATINLLKKASNNGKYVRFITLSGNDYPLKTNDVIFQRLIELTVEFIMGTPTEKPEKVKCYYFERWGIIGRALTHLFHWLHITRNKKALELENKEYPIYFAPQWFALSNNCISYVLDMVQKHDGELNKYFKYSLAPDELVIPTLVFNHQEFFKRALRTVFPKGTHYNEMPAIHYIDYEPVVQVFTEKDADKLLQSDKLFARKFRSGISDELIKIIDKERNQ